MGIIYFKNKKINIGPAVKKESPIIQPELVVLPQPCQTLSPVVVSPQVSFKFPVFDFIANLQINLSA